MIGKCDKCKEEKKIVSRVFLFEGDEEPLFQYCADCMKITDESTATGREKG